jgi:hypothetical protein
VLSSWIVPVQGYHPDTTPQELTLQAATALNKKDITAVRVEAVSAQGKVDSLVTVHT